MSLFTDYVVKLERRRLRARDGAMPLIEISRSYERVLLKYILIITAILAVVIVISCIELVTCPGCDETKMENTSYQFRESFGKSRLIFIAFAVFMYAYTVVSLIHAALQDAVNERIRVREEKALAIAAEEARKAAVAAEQARQQALAVAEQVKRQQALYDFRVQALRQMENGLKELLFDRRERAEWIPESTDEEHLYEMIRKRLKQASKDVPEFGILRRSSDILVVMILGDRSCLPAEPSDEVLSRRQLPPVTKLLS